MKIARYTSKGARGIIVSMLEDEYAFLVGETGFRRLVLNRDGTTFWITRAHMDEPGYGYSVEKLKPDQEGYNHKVVFARDLTADLEPAEIGRVTVPAEHTTYNSAGEDLPALCFKWSDIEVKPVIERSNRGRSHYETRMNKIRKNQEEEVLSRDKPEMVPELGLQSPAAKQPKEVKRQKREMKDVVPPKDKIVAAAFPPTTLAPRREEPGTVSLSEDRRQLRLALDTINEMIRRGEAKAHINEAGEIEVSIIRIEQL